MRKIGIKRSITVRWAVNTLGLVIIILLAVGIMLLRMAENYYISTTEQYLISRTETINSALSRFTSANAYRSEVRSIIEKFTEKDKFELLVLNSDGIVTITSSGFQPSGWVRTGDFWVAESSEDGTAVSDTTLQSGEHVMYYTAMLPALAPEYSALMIMTSLDNIDTQLSEIGLLLVAISGVIVLLMLASGLYFVKSIVLPVRQISETARNYALGDFSDRIEKRSDDELGDLCDSVNYMAEALENTDKMKNEFISSVSHELRTPLTAIKGWSETLCEMGDDPETFRKGMRVITGETERLSEMVEELLDFSRIQDGRFSLTKEPTDILAELGDAVLIYTERARELGIEIEYFEPEMLPFVYGDASRLRQVFINIIDNAVKYSNEGGKVSIEAYAEGGSVIVLISDIGVGISAEDLPKVKEKFYKANHTRRGSGIGLAVANEIVEMHGGSLIINSELGKGTTVMITLPAMSGNKPAKGD